MKNLVRTTAALIIGVTALPVGAQRPAGANPQVLTSLSPQILTSSNPQILRVTLDEALKRGLETSHRLAEVLARKDAASAAADVQRAAAMPQVAAQAGYTRTNHVETFGVLLPNNQLRVIYPDIPDNYRTRLDLQWPI